MKNSKYLPNGMRSLHHGVTRQELADAEEAVRKASHRTQSQREELQRAEQAEAKRRTELSRIRSAIAKSGLVD